MNADAQSFGELLLRQAGKSSQGDDVLHRINLAPHDALALPSRNGASEIFAGQLANLINHECPQDALKPKMPVEKADFLLRSFSGAHDANDAFLTLRVDDHHDAGAYYTDGDEAIFFARMLLIVDYKLVVVAREQFRNFGE